MDVGLREVLRGGLSLIWSVGSGCWLAGRLRGWSLAARLTGVGGGHFGKGGECWSLGRSKIGKCWYCWIFGWGVFVRVAERSLKSWFGGRKEGRNGATGCEKHTGTGQPVARNIW